MVKRHLFWLVYFYFAQLSLLSSQDDFNNEEVGQISHNNQKRIPCATLDPTVDQIIQSKLEVDRWINQNNFREREQNFQNIE